MRDKHSKGAHIAAFALALAAAGCSVGQGSPDGWRYLRRGAVDVALPKTWQPTADGAVLLGAFGRTDAVLTVTGGARPVPAPAPGAGRGQGPADAYEQVPADARRQTLMIDGHAARVFGYARPAPDGRPAGHVEVRAVDAAGRPLTLRAWAVDSAGHAPALLQEIVNSIEFPRAATASAPRGVRP
jgi:hypothetical protein